MRQHWTGTVEIAAPVERVFAYLEDFPRHAEWARTLQSLELIRPGDASGVGARYLTVEGQATPSDGRRRWPLGNGMRARTICEVREVTPGRRIAWHAHPKPRMAVSGELSFDFEPTVSGGTRLTQTIDMRMAGIWQPVMRSMGWSQEKVRAEWAANLQRIKAILEAPEAPAEAATQQAVQQPASTA